MLITDPEESTMATPSPESNEAVNVTPAVAEPSAEPGVRAASRRHVWRRAVAGAAASVLAVGGIAVIGVGAYGLTTADDEVAVASADTSTTSTATRREDAKSDDADAIAEPTFEDAMPDMPSAPGGAGDWPGSDGSSGIGSLSTQEEATEASDDESTGIVLIETYLGYDDAEAAGTGMVLTSDGLVLTNNHVIEGATEITVTIGTTGETYAATVLGVDEDDDVALLQLEGASGLTTVDLDDDGDPVVGDEITAVGNAEGGGVLMAADGTVTALESSVTTSSSYTIEGETLDGMIQFEADVVSGDSGGALLDDEGEVVGMSTAASSSLATVTAFAVPIDDALEIVELILAGDESDGVEIGYPAFLGIGIASDATGAMMPGAPGSTTSSTEGADVAYVFADTPAADTGLEAGDTITAVDGTAVASGEELSDLLGTYEPGDTVTVTWTDTSGETQSATVTLIEGPAA